MKRLIIFLSIAALIAGCRKDTEEISSSNTSNIFGLPAVYVNGTIAGQVVNEAGTALTNIPVRIGSETTYTEENGYFLFRNVPLNTRGAFVHVDHPSHWHASRKVVPQHNSTHYTTLTLMPKSFQHQVSANDGGMVTLPDGLAIEFDPNSFVTSTGTPFQGTVVVAARWLDPTQTGTQHMMPGAFHGINSTNKEVTLKNYGIAGVELISTSGDPIRIAEGATATLVFPVPAQLEGAAPSTIALWHFDESSGFWREEGTAQRDGAVYTAQVSHFSFWSVNESFDTVVLEGTVTNEGGEPLANTQVSVHFPDQNTFATGFTNANGMFSGLVPSGELLVLTISDACNFSVYAQNIPPLSDDTDLGFIEVEASDVSTTTISGSLANCDGGIVNAAIVQICWPQGCQFIIPNADGTFEQTFTWCGTAEFNIGIVDYSTGETFATTAPATSEVALGLVQVCEGPLETYISLDFNGTERFYPFPNQYIQNGNVFLRAEDSNYSFRISIPQGSAGTYINGEVSFTYFDNSTDPELPLFLVSGSCAFGECTSLSIIVTSYGEIGEFIEGTYTGNIDFTTSLQSFPNAPVSGSFRVVRNQ
jgi:hypothetical protein